MVKRGSYCLGIRVIENIKIRIGALGEISFPKGDYVYVGSALNSLDTRIQRHKRTNQGKGNVIHWHIDYLLSHPKARLKSVYAIESSDRVECKIAQTLTNFSIPIMKFGCSDCRCKSHLFMIEDWKILEKMGLKKRDLK